MTGLDTNVLVRYVTRDDPGQYRRAKAFLESTCTPENPGFINTVVLCELVWVLKAAYGAARADLIAVLEQILVTRQLEVEHRDVVRDAVEHFKQSSADFADCLIDALNRQAVCTRTMTFDRTASTLEGVDLL